MPSLVKNYRINDTATPVNYAILSSRAKVVSKWERGITVPHPALTDIPRYCRAYDCSLEELIEAFSNIHGGQQALQVAGLIEP
jgi:hypothetical protein